MNKKLLITMLILLVVIGAGLGYVLLRKNTNTQIKNSTDSREIRDSSQSSEVTTAKGVYKDYTKSTFASTKGTRLLFFHAPWCPQCRALDESIKASELPADVTIFKVDYDSNQELRTKYGVTLQTTVVKVGAEGNKVSSYVAYDEPTFQSVKQALLP